MVIHAMSDAATAKAIGQQIETMRLEKNLSQQAVADEAGISRMTYFKLTNGACTLVNLVAVLRALDEVELLAQFFMERLPSPVELLKRKGKQRKRATGIRGKADNRDEDSAHEALDW